MDSCFNQDADGCAMLLFQLISSQVELSTEGAEGVKVTFTSRCTDGELRERNFCEGLSIGQNVSTRDLVNLLCPKFADLDFI